MATTQSAIFEVILKAAGLKTGAVDASAALQDLQSQLARDKKAVQELQAAMANLQQGSVVNIDQFRQLQDELKKKKEAVASATGSILGLGGSLKKTKTGDLKDGLKGIFGQAKLAGGPLGQMAGRLENLTKLAGSGAVKYIALGGAIIGVGAAAIYAAKSLYDMATASAEARREENLQLQGQLSLADGLMDTAGASAALQASIDRVSLKTPAARSQLAGLATQLHAAGLEGAAFDEALLAAGNTAAVQGDEAAKAWVETAVAFNKAGGSVSELAGDVDRQIGGIARAKMLTTTVQAEKFKEAMASIFKGVDDTALVKAKAGWTSMFDQATSSGKAFKALVEPISQMLIDGATDFHTTMQKVVTRVLIWAIKLQTQWLIFRRTLHQMLPEGIFDGFNDKENIIWGLVAAATALAIALAPVAISAAAAAAPFVLAAVAIWAVINTSRLLFKLWQEMDFSAVGKQLYADLIAPLVNWFTDYWDNAMIGGGQIIKGWIAGIKNKAGELFDAIKQLAKDAWKVFKGALGISSPSKVFSDLANEIPAGIKEGIDQGKPQVDRSLINLVDPNLVADEMSVGNAELLGSATAANAQAAVPGSASSTSTTNNFVFNVTGENAKQITSDIEEMIRRVFSVTAQQIGVAA